VRRAIPKRRASTGPARLLWHTVNLTVTASVVPLGHTRARTNRDSRNYADNRHNLSHSKVQFLPRSREKSSASFHYLRVVSRPVSRPRDKRAPPMRAFTICFEAFFRTNSIMSYRIHRIERTEGSLKNKISAVAEAQHA